MFSNYLFISGSHHFVDLNNSSRILVTSSWSREASFISKVNILPFGKIFILFLEVSQTQKASLQDAHQLMN